VSRTTDKLTWLGEAAQAAKLKAIELNCSQDDRDILMKPVMLAEELIEELRRDGSATETVEEPGP
jgi:hypothetical protein